MNSHDTETVVEALQRLIIFGADQAGAYRELFEPIAAQLGSGFPTRLTQWLSQWAVTEEKGVVILTGNAGTGKTAAAESFCRALDADLPVTDDLVEVAGALVAKDVSGVSTRASRASLFREVLTRAEQCKALVCANEGVLRDAAEDLTEEFSVLSTALDLALEKGAYQDARLRVINVNRQRATSPGIWNSLLDFVTHASLWSGCDGCPGLLVTESDGGCPLMANASALRRPDTREVLRTLFQVACGDAVPTMRESLAILAYSICGSSAGEAGDLGMWRCEAVRARARDRGGNAFTAASAYYNLIFGAGVGSDAKERSPFMGALGRLGAGDVADLQIDEWLRDTGRAPNSIAFLAGGSETTTQDSLLAGSKSSLDRIRTAAGEMTFHKLGEVVSISEDDARVRAGIRALVGGDPSGLQMWRRRVMFEGSSEIGGPHGSVGRLSGLRCAPDLLKLAASVANGADVVTDIKQLIKGLNFLVAGFADASEGLIIPEPASLFARNPGSFRPARPAFIHAKVPPERISLAVPDTGLVGEFLDVDHIEVRLLVDGSPDMSLTIRPVLYEAIRDAEAFKGPVGHGTAEMTELRSFYGRVASIVTAERGLQLADPMRSALVRIQLPHFAS